MKNLLSRYYLGLFVFAVLLFSQETVFAQQTDLSNEKIVEKTASSVVLVLTSKGAGVLDKVGSGVIVRSDGVILTAYHVIKDATQVQIRLKNGEIYDRVDLLGYDERRDVAAIKISATNLSAVAVNIEEPKSGGKVFVISNPQTLSWTIADGLLSAVRMADEIPNAGRGFRVLQFSAPVSPGSSGGLLTDEKGQAIGLIVASMTSGQNLNFAIPLSSVGGLADSSKTLLSFGKGNELELPQIIRPPTSVDIVNADPKAMLRNAKVFYISSDAELITSTMMQNALQKMPEFEKWKLVIVENKSDLADILISVDHQLYTFDYRYSMTDRRTNILLATGKVTVWDGKIASQKFAKMIITKLRQLRQQAGNTENKKETNMQTSEKKR
ncbi:MAG: S1C family serine protease [Acidobacteriota bacterium]|nr:S1C family serine protease [Acidobacteriota bacterium]